MLGAERGRAELDRLQGKLAAPVRVRDDAIEALDSMQTDRDQLAAEVERWKRHARVIQEQIDGYRGTAAHHVERAKRHASAIYRVRAECDRIESAVNANATNAELAGGYLGCLRHIRAALDGTGEA